MIHIQISEKHRQLMVTGHDQDERICGAITMLLRAAATLASRARFEHGQSAVELREEWPEDFEALTFGVLTLIAKSKSHSVTYVDRLPTPIQLL